MGKTGILRSLGAFLLVALVAASALGDDTGSAINPGFVDRDGDGIDDNVPDLNGDGIPDDLVSRAGSDKDIAQALMIGSAVLSEHLQSENPGTSNADRFSRREFATRSLCSNRSECGDGFGSGSELGVGAVIGNPCSGGYCPLW